MGLGRDQRAQARDGEGGVWGEGRGGGEAGLQHLDKVCPEKVNNRDQPFLHWGVLHPHP